MLPLSTYGIILGSNLSTHCVCTESEYFFFLAFVVHFNRLMASEFFSLSPFCVENAFPCTDVLIASDLGVMM